MNLKKQIDETFDENIRINLLVKEKCYLSISKLVDLAKKTMKQNGKIILFGNGGSAADSQHIAAEFMGKFKNKKRFLQAISLTTNSSALSAIGNDFGFDEVFSIQVKALASKNDLVIGISTSGNSINVINGIKEAKKTGCKTASLTGSNGGKLAKIAGINIKIPSTNTQRIQESHILVGHILCEFI